MEDQGKGAPTGQKCVRCGRGQPPGSLTYIAQIRIFAGFDGVLLDPEEDADDELTNLLEQVEQANPEDLEKEIYQEFTLLLCKGCRDRFVGEIEHPWEGLFRISGKPDQLIH